MFPDKLNQRNSDLVKVYVCRLLLVIFGFVFLYQTGKQIYAFWTLADVKVDFTSFYSSARLAYLPHQLYELDAQTLDQTTLAHRFRYPPGVLPFLYPPFFALLLVPLTLFSLPVAYLIWGTIQLIGFATGAKLITTDPSLLAANRRLDVWLALFASFPVFAAWYQGQASGLIFMALAAFLYYYRRQKFTTAGLALAAMGMKPQFALLWWLCLLLNRSWSILKGLSMGLIILFGLPLIWFGVSGYGQWLTLLLSPADQLSSMDLEKSYSIRSLFELAGVSYTTIIWLTLTVLTATALYFFQRYALKQKTLPVIALVVLSLYLSPVLHFHDLSLFLIALPWLSKHLRNSRWYWTLLPVVLIPIVSLMLGVLSPIPSNLWFSILLILLAGIILLRIQFTARCTRLSS